MLDLSTDIIPNQIQCSFEFLRFLDWVLSRFSSAERKELPAVLERAAQLGATRVGASAEDSEYSWLPLRRGGGTMACQVRNDKDFTALKGT